MQSKNFFYVNFLNIEFFFLSLSIYVLLNWDYPWTVKIKIIFLSIFYKIFDEFEILNNFFFIRKIKKVFIMKKNVCKNWIIGNKMKRIIELKF